MMRYRTQGRCTRAGAAALALVVASGCAAVEPARYTASSGFSVFQHAASSSALPPPSEKPADGTPISVGPAVDRLPVLAVSPAVALEGAAIGARSGLLHLGRDLRGGGVEDDDLHEHGQSARQEG